MWKIQRKVISETEDEEQMGSVYDTYLDEAKKLIFRLIFSLAILAKVTPKRLALEFSKTKADDYATKFNAEVAKLEDSKTEELRARLNRKKKTKD